MKLIAQIKLLPSTEQFNYLKKTLESANAACNYASEQGWQYRTFGQYALHKLCYRSVREKFCLCADATVRVFSKVSDAYKLDKHTQRIFKPMGAFPFNDRLVSYKLNKGIISIWTMNGRQKMPFVCGEHQAKLLEGLRGECDLVFREDSFYLFQCCDVEESPLGEISDFLGVDLGITNIAVDSKGTIYQGNIIKSVRHRNKSLRSKLQKKGTKSAKRLLKKRSRKESRFVTDVNHCISKRVVKTAHDTGCGIALEELTHIRSRVKARRSQRAALHSWSFAKLRLFIEYKAALAGVPVVFIDPHNTSRTCPECGFVSKSNRPNQSIFSCQSCGFAGLADYIAAVNIRGRALVNVPNVSPNMG